jgi:putative ABC transport system ATP-binding protein
MHDAPPTSKLQPEASDQVRAPGGPIVRVIDAGKTYTEGPAPVVALRGVSLSIDPGTFTAVMGPSGSGKSTLLNLIGGLEQADAGAIEIDGRSLSSLSDYELALFRRRKIGFIFQHLNLIPTLTARENTALPLLIDGKSPAEAAPLVEAALARVGLNARADHRPDALSGGEQQRVAIARSLTTMPAVILADEPTGNLDSENGLSILRLLRELTRPGSAQAAAGEGGNGAGEPGGRTIVMVTHEPRAAAFADEICFLRDGRLVGRQRLTGNVDAAFVADCYQRHQSAPAP